MCCSLSKQWLFSVTSYCGVQAIDKLDSSVLHADLLPQLSAVIPNETDITLVWEAVDSFGGYKEVRGRLGAADTLCMELHRVERVQAKLEVLKFMQDFVDTYSDLTVCIPLRSTLLEAHSTVLLHTLGCISGLQHCRSFDVAGDAGQG